MCIISTRGRLSKPWWMNWISSARPNGGRDCMLETGCEEVSRVSMRINIGSGRHPSREEIFLSL
jgi:hypothetical protein